jgi:ABC-type multidrug transport system ATPase subunit
VARALLLRPRLLILDEPFAGLDPSGRIALLGGLERIDPKTAVLVSDHAADDVLAFAGRVLLLLEGALAYDGPRAAFSPDLPAWRRYFGLTAAGASGA